MLHIAFALALFTVIYNFLEGVVSVYFGMEDQTLTLFGFGLDSFVEVISGVGIGHMVLRIRNSNIDNTDNFEQTALKITGYGFYLLTIGLLITSVYNLYIGAKPDTTLWGIIIASISISVMWVLIHYKIKVGENLQSDAIIADANCTRVCMQLSFVLLTASLGYEILNIHSIDAIGGIIIAGISYREGKEAFEKARNKFNCC